MVAIGAFVFCLLSKSHEEARARIRKKIGDLLGRRSILSKILSETVVTMLKPRRQPGAGSTPRRPGCESGSSAAGMPCLRLDTAHDTHPLT